MTGGGSTSPSAPVAGTAPAASSKSSYTGVKHMPEPPSTRASGPGAQHSNVPPCPQQPPQGPRAGRSSVSRREAGAGLPPRPADPVEWPLEAATAAAAAAAAAAAPAGGSAAASVRRVPERVRATVRRCRGSAPPCVLGCPRAPPDEWRGLSIAAPAAPTAPPDWRLAWAEPGAESAAAGTASEGVAVRPEDVGRAARREWRRAASSESGCAGERGDGAISSAPAAAPAADGGRVPSTGAALSGQSATPCP
mmetsp:Transcript_2711/g.10876  ORF Transcript_2711/g.10876 Transcript_2711/m.10876 type:complete len:251 (-) Transcript_2711:1692-2444(-)